MGRSCILATIVMAFPASIYSDTRLLWGPTAPKITDLHAVCHRSLVGGSVAVSGRVGERTGGVGRVGRVEWVGWDGSGGLGWVGWDAITGSSLRSSEASVLLVESRCFDLRANRQTMGDFPRWLDRDDVDSCAMYSAYLAYDLFMRKEYFFGTGAYRPVWDGHLHMIMHEIRVDGVPRRVTPAAGGRVREVPCQRRPCLRCESGRGGYQFRWFSPYWAKFYNERRREGSWRAPTGEPTAAASLRFWVLK